MSKISSSNLLFEETIKNCKRVVRKDNDSVIASTETLEGFNYAFYLYVDGKVVEKSRYSPNPTYYFETKPISLDVLVKFFYKKDINNKFSIKQSIESNRLLSKRENSTIENTVFMECLELLRSDEINFSIIHIEKNFEDLNDRSKAHKYVKLINFAKSNNYREDSLQILSKVAVQLFEDRYTLMAHAGACIDTGNIIEANSAISKLQNTYQVEVEKISRLNDRLAAAVTKHVEKLKLLDILTDDIASSKSSFQTQENKTFFSSEAYLSNMDNSNETEIDSTELKHVYSEEKKLGDESYIADLQLTQNKNTEIETEQQFGIFKYSDTIELPQKDPIWYELPVQEGQVLTIKAASQYKNTGNITNRKAILLIKSHDSNGIEVLEPCGKMSHSPHLDAYFKYLPCTDNLIQELHTFTVPNGVSQISIGLCSFTKSEDEQIFVSNINIEPKLDRYQLRDEVSFGSFKHEDTVELPKKEPIWYEVSVQVGQELIIKAASQYKNTGNITNRKAILLIKSYDSNGNEVIEPCGKMSHSSHLDAYFKYLPSTDSLIQELHTFTVPNGISQIHIGLCSFNIVGQEQVFVKNFSIEPKLDKSQNTKFVVPSAQAAEISIIGWPEYPANDKPYIIGIMDEFTTGSFEQDVNLIQPRPNNWFALAEKYKPVLFFIESAWKGNYGSWQYRVGQYANKPGREIEHICQYARDKGIPTLFWNKEDPVHHDKFMCSAKLVDHIYTTDANMKASYTAKTGNTNVHSLPFAAQPALHKPAALLGRKLRSCFAGSWYGNRHAERGEAMGWLLQAANNYGLDIYDRNYGTGIFPFPEEYRAGIQGSLSYKDLCKEYSRYRVFLNVNSVTESPTMFSRRVFELMACGTPVVSTYAKGIEALFDSDAVWLVNSQQEADEAIRTLMTDDVEWRRRSLAGIREIFSKHTYAHRLNSIFADMNIESRIATNPNVMLFAKANSPVEIETLENFVKKQNYQNFILVIECTCCESIVKSGLPENIILLELGESKAWAIKNQNDYSIAGWLTANNYYGEYYLRDLVNASIYEPNAKGWAKALNEDVFDYGEQALLSGALWKMSEFLKCHIDTEEADASIKEPDLYLADSDQFKNARLEHQQVKEA